MTIVIIEDSRTQRAKLAADLRAAGHDVVAAEDGRAGIEACRGLPSPPDAVITDIRMPGIDGYEVCRQLRADPRLARVPVMVLTELSSPGDVLRAIEAGAANYCAKPYTPDALLDRLDRTIARARGACDGAIVVDGERFDVPGPAHLVDILVASLSDAASRYHELERSRAEMERMGRQREDVMRMVVHELRSPVQALLTAAKLAPRHEGVRNDLPALVTRQGQRIDRVVSDLSDLTKIELGRLSVEAEPLDLVEIVRVACARVGPTLGGRVSVRALADSLPTLADRDRVEQILTNLLTNAAKYSPATEPIVVTVERAGDRGRVGVTDRGIGVAPEDQVRIFDRYYRATRGEATAEGLGIGLFLTRSLVEAHGGRIGVESEPGRGSTFWFELPLAP